jgi:hypothetical protein
MNLKFIHPGSSTKNFFEVDFVLPNFIDLKVINGYKGVKISN